MRRFPRRNQPEGEGAEAAQPKSTNGRNYARGAAFEHRVRAALAKLGYEVMRSSGSHGEADLIALRPGKVLFIQAKRGGQLPPEEWNLFFDAAERAGAVPLLVTPISRVGNTAKGIKYNLLTARKSGRGERQPMVDYDPKEASA